jgi:putative redox protein
MASPPKEHRHDRSRSAHSLEGSTAVELGAGTARWRADLDPAVGGAGNDPTPHQLLDSALAACTLLTLQLYAKRKQYPLTGAQVSIERDEDREVYRMRRRVTLEGALDDAAAHRPAARRQRLPDPQGAGQALPDRDRAVA